jgi:hypothetical protein
VKPEARVWRKDARRDRRGRQRTRHAVSSNSAQVVRRILRFHDARRSGLTIEDAAEHVGIPWAEAWRYEDLINALADDFAGRAR